MATKAPFTVTWREPGGAICERELRSLLAVEELLPRFRAPVNVCDAAGELVGEVHDRNDFHRRHPERWSWWLSVGP